jgi:PAS domain S-box-containing protein
MSSWLRVLALRLFLTAFLMPMGVAHGAVPGTLDLSDGWRLHRSDQPSYGEKFEDTSWTPTTLPVSWSEPAEGEARVFWLQRRVLLPEDFRRSHSGGLALLLETVGVGEWKVWVGEQLVDQRRGGSLVHRVGEAWLIPLSAEVLESLGPQEDLVIAVRFAPLPGTSSREAQNVQPLGTIALLGDREALEGRQQLEALRPSEASLPIAILVVFMGAMGLYHLQLFGRRQRALEYLWFGLLALNFAVVVCLVYWVGVLFTSYSLYRRLGEVAIHLHLPLLLLFFHLFLARPISSAVQLYLRSLWGLAFFVLAAPELSWILASDTVRWLWQVPGWLVLAMLLGRQIRDGRSEARLVGAGGAAVFLAGVCEWGLHLLYSETAMPWSIWVFALFAALMATSLAQRFERVHQELDGLRHQLERMVSDRSVELSEANDRLKSEIVERQLAEEAMRMLERAVEQSIDGIVVTNLEGVTQFVNEAWARMHGYEVFEVMGRRWGLFHTPEQMAGELEPSLEKVCREGAFDGEIGHRHQDESTFPAWMSITLLRDPEQAAVGFVAVGRDISNRRQAEEDRNRLKAKVQQARKLKSLGDLAAGIAHDYNNLLTGVLGNASLLLRALPPGSAVEKIQLIEGAAERAVDLTSQLLAYAGEDPLVLATVELNELLTELEARLRQIVQPAARLVLDLEQGLPLIEADRGQLERVVCNLVTNGVEALGSRTGTITISTSSLEADRSYLTGAYLDEGQPAGRYVRLAVIDDGAGIESTTRGRIFDPFFSTRPSARGLGLAIVLGTVRLHNGVIKIDTELERGTTFEILLPLPVEVQEAPARSRKTLADWKGSGTILVVDDEAVMREVSENILEQHGFEVLTASDGPQAVEHYRRHRDLIRLVLLDRTMPGMDGKQVLREIHSMNPGALVLLMSGYKAKEVLRGLGNAGLAGFLQKPFRPDELVRQVWEILEGEEDV